MTEMTLILFYLFPFFSLILSWSDKLTTFEERHIYFSFTQTQWIAVQVTTIMSIFFVRFSLLERKNK